MFEAHWETEGIHHTLTVNRQDDGDISLQHKQFFFDESWTELNAVASREEVASALVAWSPGSAFDVKTRHAQLLMGKSFCDDLPPESAASFKIHNSDMPHEHNEALRAAITVPGTSV